MAFAALGSWIGAYATMKYLRWRSTHTAEHAGATAPRVNAAAEDASDLVAACTRPPLPAATFPADQRFAA